MTNVDMIGRIHPLLVSYQEMAARHAAHLAPYVDEDGEADPAQYAAYDETRADNRADADEFLATVIAELTELAGPPVPGETFTLTLHGPERHDGEAATSFVVNAPDLPGAWRALVALPSYGEWYDSTAPWDAEPGTPADLVAVPEDTHPGLPEWGAYNDMRREQAEHMPALEAAQRDADSPDGEDLEADLRHALRFAFAADKRPLPDTATFQRSNGRLQPINVALDYGDGAPVIAATDFDQERIAYVLAELSAQHPAAESLTVRLLPPPAIAAAPATP